MIRDRKTVSNSILKHDLCKLVIAKMSTAITNDSTRSPKSGEERFQEFYDNSGIVCGELFCFNPFRQVVYGHENVLIPSRRREWPHEVDAPYVKDLAYLNCILGHFIFLRDFALTLTSVTPCDQVMGISIWLGIDFSIKKNQTPALAPVKAVEQSCVTCGGGHSYQNCPATDGNIYRDNIQEYVSQAAAVNYNQGNASYRPQMVANQIRPPGQVYQPQINQPPTFQAPAYQAPVPLPPGVSKPDFDNYVKANDAHHNRSGVSYNGPQISSPPKEKENEPEVTKDTVQPSTENIQPPVVRTDDQIGEPVVASKTKPTLPYPSRATRKSSVKSDLLASNFMEIFEISIFELSFADALQHAQFAPMFRKASMDKDKNDCVDKDTEYVQEVLEIPKSGNPTSTSDLMIDSRSPSFTPFGGSDFLMEEIDAFLEHDDSIPHSDPNLPPSPVCEINVPEKVKSSCEDPPDLELKDLPSHLEYAFLEGDDKFTLVTGWRVCIDYQKLNDATRKDHFPLPFMDQMLERLAGNEYYCFLDGFSGYFQIPIDPLDQEKTTFTCPYGLGYRRDAFWVKLQCTG
ncbi:hypothetical protein Tco_0093807 [Tanacetum coccineum]